MKNWRLSENATLEERKALQVLCREQLKQKLLADIAQDVTVCKLEGWNYKEYLYELIGLIKEFLK